MPPLMEEPEEDDEMRGPPEAQEQDEDDVGPEPGGDDETTESVAALGVLADQRTEVGRHDGVCETSQAGLSDET